MTIAENLEQVLANVDRAISARDASKTWFDHTVTIVGVTKNQDVTAMRHALAAGVVILGENRVQEASQKFGTIGTDFSPSWHLIGHLQTNKVRQALSMFDLIHSVDSEKLTVEIDRIAGQMQKVQDVLLQINIANEATKYGLARDHVKPLVDLITRMDHVRLCGLMTIAPLYDNPEACRPIFRELYHTFMEIRSLNLSNVSLQWLSMGMTNDYGIAVEEGANLIRIGTGLFGARNPK
ncbi:YggS family pyridoxal phosphate-dependent enzyme [Acetonema longum]|uniref:Pyridoxal phosphate homeostasis protein n=1 Tax=Acetonema longum DSM 6540 TaxID=1009370 RepID=F7NLB4_9FIRM|nr:YggS family pyridoxal phosphate-dependent enzyme [Acetonema longum]EGO63219.1 alanine racemase domain protein [Acetonema longum DSM 6540]